MKKEKSKALINVILILGVFISIFISVNFQSRLYACNTEAHKLEQDILESYFILSIGTSGTYVYSTGLLANPPSGDYLNMKKLLDSSLNITERSSNLLSLLRQDSISKERECNTYAWYSNLFGYLTLGLSLIALILSFLVYKMYKG